MASMARRLSHLVIKATFAFSSRTEAWGKAELSDAASACAFVHYVNNDGASACHGKITQALQVIV